MRTTLFALHGMTLHGALMRASLHPLIEALADDIDVICPDAPHVCPAPTVDRLYAAIGGKRAPPPHLAWWDATDDGRVYRGWERTLDQVRAWLAPHPGAGLVGFSQGAILATALAGLSAKGELAPLGFVVLIAGRAPRADLLQPYLQSPIAVPSLHVWGSRDPGAEHAAALVERFDPATRVTAPWRGPHVVPTRGVSAEAMVDFVRRFVRPRPSPPSAPAPW